VSVGFEHAGSSMGCGQPSPPDPHWGAADWLFCRDGKWRPVEPRTFPLAHGIPGRVGLLRGYGNAIVPPLAAVFIEAFLESTTTLA
jgi:DNA (cytosine-5)-methyltransferase 1